MANQQSALDSFMQYYAAPNKAESPTRSALRHSSYNLAPMSDEFDYEKSPGMKTVASSPNPGAPGLRVSLPLENYLSSPIAISPVKSASSYDSTTSPSTSLPLKKSTSTPQIPSNSKFGSGRESSDSSFSSLSRSDSDSTPGLERSNSFVILSGDDSPQGGIFVLDDYDDDDTEDTFSSEIEGDDSPTSTSSRSDGPSPPSSITGTVKRKSTNARYFPTSEASLEKFFKPPDERGDSGEETKEGGVVRFQKVTDDDFSRMSKNFPEGKRSGGLSHRRRRSTSKIERESSFAPSQDTLLKSSVLKQVFFEKHSLMASDPKRYQQELLSARGALEPRSLPADVKKKLKKLNIQFLATREQRPTRDRSKSSPPVSAHVPRSLSLSEILKREGTTIPRIVKQSLDFLSTEEMLNTEGLFRVAGNSYEIDVLWDSLNEGESIPPNCDVHTVTSVFKRFFRELKEPLFTFKLHKKFLQAVNDDLTEQETIQKLKETLGEVPEANRRIIRELFDFLNKVIAHSKSNMMHAVNLGIVFGPSLLRDDSSSMGAMFDNRNQVVTTILENYNAIFDVPGTAQ